MLDPCFSTEAPLFCRGTRGTTAVHVMPRLRPRYLVLIVCVLHFPCRAATAVKDAAAAKSAAGGGAKASASATATATAPSEGGGDANAAAKGHGKVGEGGAEADPEAEAAAERVRRALDIRGRIRDSSRMPVVEGEVCTGGVQVLYPVFLAYPVSTDQSINHRQPARPIRVRCGTVRYGTVR